MYFYTMKKSAKITTEVIKLTNENMIADAEVQYAVHASDACVYCREYYY